MVAGLRGPVLEPVSGTARQMVLLLHGYGSSGDDLIGLAPHWQAALPAAVFIAPHGSGRCPGPFESYQWWALSSLSGSALTAGAASAAPVLDAFIDQQLEHYGLSEDKLLLVGFSQGTMMALHVGPRRRRRIAGIIGYSGMLTDAHALAREMRNKPPVLLVHGAQDSVIPIAALHEAEHDLKRLGFDVSAHVSPGLDHAVDPTGLRLGLNFARRQLGLPGGIDTTSPEG